MNFTEYTPESRSVEGVEDRFFLIHDLDAKFVRFRTIYVVGGANLDCYDTDDLMCWPSTNYFLFF